MTDIPDDKLMTLDEVAAYLGLHPRTVTRYIAEGKLTAITLGKAYRIQKCDLQAFLDARKGGVIRQK